MVKSFSGKVILSVSCLGLLFALGIFVLGKMYFVDQKDSLPDANQILAMNADELKQAFAEKIDILGIFEKETELSFLLFATLYFEATEIMEVLLDNGADPNAVDGVGNSILALLIESRFNRSDVVPDPATLKRIQLLIQAGARTDALYHYDNYEGKPQSLPLTMLIIQSCQNAGENMPAEAIKILLENGALDPLLEEDSWVFSSYLRRRVSKNPACAGVTKVIMLPPAILKQYDTIEQLVSLSEVVRDASLEDVKKWVASGLDVNGFFRLILSWVGTRNLLQLVFTENKTKQRNDIIDFLLESGTDVNAQTATKRTALHFATYYKDKDFLQILLKRGADPNIVDEYEKTPLWLAITEFMADYDYASQEDLEIAEILLDAGADPNVEYHDYVGDYVSGYTPLSYVFEGCLRADRNSKGKVLQGLHLQLTKLLLVAGAKTDSVVESGSYGVGGTYEPYEESLQDILTQRDAEGECLEIKKLLQQ